MQLEDRTGTIEAMVFSTQYERLVTSLEEDRAVLVKATVMPEENSLPKLNVQDIIALDNARVDMPTLISIRIWVDRNGEVDRAVELNQLFSRKQGRTEVRLRLEKTRDFSVILDVPVKVRPDREFIAEVKRICGPEAMEVLAR